jgi:cytochrome c oxidase assembly protein subunit 15
MRRFAWTVLAYFALVAVWGAFVRATGSGAGCGSHWPLCNGEVVPRAPSVATAIEFFHRATSGLAGVLIVGLLVVLVRRSGWRHPATRAALGAFFLTVVEASVGAGLVKFDLVAGDPSALRAVVMAVHLVNTYLLLIVLTLIPLNLGRSERPARWLPDPAFKAAFAGMALVGVSGAIAALGDTLFPATSFAESLQQDLSPTAHFLLRLRLFHPFLAVALAVGLVLLARRSWARSPQLAGALTALVACQLLAGFVNLALLAPVALQLVHLLLAYSLLVALVVLADGEPCQSEPQFER